CLVKVIPITAHRPEHGDGLLVTAGPLEPDFYDVFGHLGQWGALLGAAMDRKHLVDELQKMALHDALTGLPNRSLLMDRLEQAIARAKRDADFRFAVLFLDLDRFKTINDSLGHVVGDELLVMIADRLRGCLRATDTVARLGGDEFALVVTELADPEDAELVARRVHAVLEAPFEIGGHRVFTSGSIGIALGSETMGRAQDFLRDADIAMYRAKNAGRARHELFDAGMHAQAITRLRVEADLRRALERGELFLEYQPVVDLPDCGVGGVEALIRWRHPEQGIVPPLTFLPIADETGLIVPISQWVVATACRQAAAWRAELGRPVRVHVNVPSQQLKDPGFADSVAAHLASAGIGAEGLGIELVESSLIENGERTDRLLARLREMGVPVAIDDFGTGYSSLAYLKRFPVDAIKIDRSLLHGAPADANDNAICSAIVAMARSLRLRVVAEGVERREQLDFLRSLGCSGVQGYLFSRPLPAAACKDVLRAGFLRPPSSSERALRPATSPPPTE
ncbi:MAG TPA: EAL domain-containing protein, partial [Polyangiaceae bacterium]|nr:EAL domain-containing protein [Polyangiaceae bacterium]